MTREEIIETYSMRDIVERYGIHPDSHGLCKCPFHDDRRASMKIYAKDFHCFTCGAHGDMFTFIEKMDGVGFREAFLELGGTYEKEPSESSREAIRRAQAEREKREREQAETLKRKRHNLMMIDAYRACLEDAEPMSDLWCYCMNGLQYELYLHGELNNIPF